MSDLNIQAPPKRLIKAIQEGRCVAFVGAGFSMPTTPSWVNLLKKLAEQLKEGSPRTSLLSQLRTEPDGRTLEGIAQTIEGELGGDFRDRLQTVLSPKELKAENAARIQLLSEIPFHYVLTTNFDTLLKGGRVPGKQTYAQALTATRRPWWHNQHWGSGRTLWDDRLVKLHGDATKHDEALAFTTEAYRRLLHEQPAYRSFLRTLFATHTILFMGFSFSDAYINDLRSEILAMLGLDRSAGHMDYAILENIGDQTARHLEKHDGLVALSYPVKDGTGYDGFDKILGEIHAQTNPASTLKARIGDRKLLWLDANPDNNAYGMEVLREVGITQVMNVETALQQLREGNRSLSERGIDLVITHWGHADGQDAAAVALLKTMRAEGIYAPVIVFASGAHRTENRAKALRLGALAYTDDWGELFHTLDRFFTDDHATTF